MQGESVMNVAFMASHNGTNIVEIIHKIKRGKLKLNPVLIISNNKDASILAYGEKEKIATYHISKNSCQTEEKTTKELLKIFKNNQIDLIILSGYMKKIPPEVVKEYKNRIINIHPALLPKYGGSGMYGDKIYQEILKSGDEVTGVTIHLVDNDYDTGRVLVQKEVDVYKNDNIESLSKRVQECEKNLYVKALCEIVSGKIEL